MEVYADGGVRHGTDIAKLLALGVKGIGIGRSYVPRVPASN
jgi:L-lactate dehydrogenase (cytochrome)